ncbi:MAG: D-2-hydroxyacid dehydrogenase [Blautia sp.]|nr:D-2-hydroxyacid dehydrogenase [Blautia sp.]
MAKINKVVTTVWYNKEDMRALRQVFADAAFVYVDFYDKEKLQEEVRDADAAIILGDVDSCLLGENTLKWIHCDHAGLNGSARPEVFARGIPVTGAAGRSAPVMAEHCIYFMLQSCYHTKELIAAQNACKWGVEGSNAWRGLYGRTAGIIGMGNNGRMVAERLHAFGMKLLVYDKFPVKGVDYAAGSFSEAAGDTIEPVVRESDFVILTLALTDDTYHMIDYDMLSRMKKDAFLVNIARGGIVCTEDLARALEEGLIGGAGLDVFEEEPLAAESPLWNHPNVYITPHCTPQVPHRAGRSIEIIQENARRLEAGEPLLNLLRPEMAVTTEQTKSGWSRLMNSNLTKEQIRQMDLEKFLGKRGWTDPAEWM